MPGPLDCNTGDFWYLNPLCLIPSAAPTDAEVKTKIDAASNGNAVLAEGAYQQYLRDKSKLVVLQANDPTPDPFGVRGFLSSLDDTVNNFINKTGDAAKTAAVTVGLVEVVLGGVVIFAAYKILMNKEL